MDIIEAALALAGIVALVLFTISSLAHETAARPADPPVEDVAAPYREGLHAAVRMQRVAQDLEAQIYAEAAQHMQAETKTTQIQRRQRP